LFARHCQRNVAAPAARYTVRHCERSEAIQSSQRLRLPLWIAASSLSALLAMTIGPFEADRRQ
jgi:hypothetical protein